jgi:NO-binding membrane sensor protein with MHYT domain
MIEVSYNYLLVGLSFVIACFGSYNALQLAIHIPTAKGSELWWWLIGAAVALGGGAIWSMHFIGMLAYKMPMEVEYDVLITIGSLLLAIGVASVGLFIVGRGGQSSIIKLIFAGIAGGLGVAGMHYMGMAAMIMPADIIYDQNILILSIVIAVVATTVALWLAFNLRGNLQRFGSAIIMGIAVCGMHYTAMSGVTMVANNGAEIRASFIAPETMAFFIFAISSTLLGILLVCTSVFSTRNKTGITQEEIEFE